MTGRCYRWTLARGVTTVLALLGPAGAAAAELAAFQGAEGWGASAVGGRGGRVIRVSNLRDSGPGSLRAAVEAVGPRIVVFAVGGTIQLESAIEIENSHLTIAGQTAPGGGILLRARAGSVEPLLRIRGDVHDIVIRYLRLRIGPTEARNDNLTIHGGRNVVIDHVSMSWSTDENAGFYRKPGAPALENLTIQRSLIAEGLAGSALGLLASGKDDRTDPEHPVEAWRQVRSISIHHNLFAHNTHRNPRVTAVGARTVNNVVYNWRTRIGSTTRGAVVDYANNFSRFGPMRADDLVDRPSYVRKLLMHHEHQHRETDDWPDPSIYTVGNIVEPGILTDPEADNWVLWGLNYSDPKFQPLPGHFRRHEALPAASIPIRIESAALAYDSVMADVGANARLDCAGRWVPAADAVDLRILEDVRNGTGPDRPVASPAAVGGYPAIAAGAPCSDRDGDGMPDEWETLRGLNADDPSDGPADTNGDGYTNLDSYLNGTYSVPPTSG